MNHFVHRMLGHYLQDEAEEGADLGGADEQEQEEEEGEQEEGQEGEEQDDGADEEGGMVVTIGDEEPQEEQDDKSAPAWVKDLRKTQRELQRENRELKARLEQSTPKQEVPALGKKPSMSDSDIDYDEEKFEAALSAWHERKRKIDQAEEDKRKQAEQQEKDWQARLDMYTQQKSSLKVKDYEDAESLVHDSFDVTQQGIIVQGSDNAALVVYALGKNSAKAKELSQIKDPIKFAFAVAKLEAQLKVQKRSEKPAPERVVSGSGGAPTGIDSTLDRLRKEAEKTGDMSKVLAYKRQQKQKSA